MATQIHPTAIIEDGAQIGEDVKIGPYCVIGSKVKLGDRVELKSHVVIDGNTTIGEETVVYPFVSLGMETPDMKYKGEDSELIIGKRNKIREHTTMNPGTENDKMKTVVGDDCLFMVATHVAHDCVVGNHVIMANNATLAGHVEVGDYAVLGGLSAVKQFVRIGEHAMIGGMSGVENNVIPYGLVMGERAKLAGLNLVGLQRRGFSREEITALNSAYKTMFDEDGTMADRIERVAKDLGDKETVKNVVNFARVETRIPLCKPKKEAV